MPEFLASAALLPEGWARDVLVAADAAGDILAVRPGCTRPPPGAERLPGVVIPGVPNLHGHAQRRAAAGEGERRGPEEDGGEAAPLRRLADRLTPEDAEAIAAMVYVELLEQGFTAICEVVELHHQRDGAPYGEPAEMALRHLAAARAAGIGVTLLPALQAPARGGPRGAAPPPPGGPRRAASDLELYARIVEGCRAAAAASGAGAGTRVGVAPHSLRAVTPQMLACIGAFDGPIHIHAAGQRREVEECLALLHARPVEWLLDNAPLDERWCVVHATHLTPAEVEDLAASGAVAGLCPGAEAARGDGVFPLRAYLARGGRFGIGTDGHLGTAPREELRLLETGQRQALGERPVAATAARPHPGRLLLEAALAGGAQASGRPIGAIAPGLRCDLVELDPEHPALVARVGDRLLDAWIFGGGGGALRGVICGGRRVVEAGRHHARPQVAARFARTMRRLLG